MSMLSVVAFTALLVGSCKGMTDGLPRANSSGTVLLPLGPKAFSTFVTPAPSLPVFSTPVGSVHFSRYADPDWDQQYMGSPLYYMGLGQGGCGYGNLLNANKYPYLMAFSLSPTTRQQLALPPSSVGCGACIRITCPPSEYYCKKGAQPIVGVVTDVCPEEPGHSSGNICLKNHMDMYIQAWSLIAEGSNPKVMIERVKCPTISENIVMYVMRNEGPFSFFKINFQNVGGSGVLTEVQLICDGTKRIWLNNQYGAVWATNRSLSTMDECMFKLTTDDWATVETGWMKGLKLGVMDEYEGVQYVDVRDTGVQFGSPPATAPTTRPVQSTDPAYAAAKRKVLGVMAAEAAAAAAAAAGRKLSL